MAYNSVDSFLRLSGMASGLDTESMVKSLMKVERLKVDRIWQQKTRLEWQKDVRAEVSGKIAAFRSATMSVLSRDTNLFSSAAFNTFKITQQGGGASFTAAASEQAAAGNHSIDAISQLATAATATSGAPIAAGPLNRNARLADLALTVPLTFGGTNGDELTFSINDATITVKKDDTLQTLLNQINASKANVIASWSELTGRFALTSRSTGTTSSILIANVSGNAFGDGSALGITASAWQNGQNARLTIDGVEITRSSNSFAIDGVSYQLNAELATPAAFTVGRDVEPAISRIRSFVSQYNSLLDDIQGKLGEETFKDYPPLTSEQREGMSESEAKLWDEKARSGLLRQDRALLTLVDQMRRAFYDPLTGSGKCVANVGLKTGLYTERGRIVLDETALRTALTDNPDEVTRLFTQTSASADAKVKYESSGLLPRLSDAISAYGRSVDTVRANEQIANLDGRMNEMNTSLSRKEEMYWRKFSAMEQALYTMQSQSTWLSNQKL